MESAVSSQQASQAPATVRASSNAGAFGTSGPGLGEYLRIVYRHRWLAVVTFLLVSVPVGLYGMLQPKAYEARVRLVLDPELSVPVPFKDSARAEGDSDGRTQQEIVRSREVVLRTILALRLWERPEFGGSGASRPPAPAPAAAPSKDDEARAEALLATCIARIKVVAIPLSRLLDVVFEAPDSRLAAEIANELAHQFIQQDLNARAASSQQASTWLGERLAEQRKKVEDSEAALQRYKEQHDALSVEDRQNIVLQRLSDLNAAVTRAKTERLARETTYAQVQRAEADPAGLDGVPAISSNTTVRQLQTQLGELRRQQVELGQRFGARHPEMIKIAGAIDTTQQRLSTEIAKAAEVVKNEYLAAQSQEQSLQRALEEQKDEALRLNKQDLEYGRLQREADTNRQIYNALLQQSQQTGITGEYKQSPVRIIDRAQPPDSPVRPQRKKFALLAMAMGLFGALGIALARELLDRRLKTPQEIHDYLQLPFLGLIPAIRGGQCQHGPTFTVAASPFSDALRRVRAMLLLATPSAGPMRVLVTSTAPREGKTTVAVGLAQCFAAAAHRVLLIDTDLRRPQAHRAWRMKSARGLSDYLAGNANLDEVLVATGTENLFIIPAGTVPPNPSEILGLPAFASLLESVRHRFDWIFLDSAPVLSVPDALQVARLTSGIVFIAGAQMASRDDVRRAEERLMQTGVPFAGCVLNRAEVEQHSYYYAPYHNQQYEAYYREQE
jgi:polysaccharide biosynthesis transport protein